ncbi:MAG: hypothetical protein JRD92_09340 [Deltaproteobacteria bacterium]|nr:hypothetical protein [Deltaproteobacteria bacterium]MBW2161795.1 hypothetical protein [Deltaproteobacteria bacterium]MBW2377264.1 hypothetical protein [Deltaproteobacteria bacterium]MBW2587134.1 hypothetical protein [Deltaproteobacteria bacterium]
MKTLGLILTLALTSTFGLSACGGGDAAVPEPECEADGDCPRGEVCEANECIPAALECEGDGDCAALEICTNNECETVECKADADCSTGVCQGFVCVDSCIGDHDQTVQCENDMWLATRRCLACLQFGDSCPTGVVPRETSITECLNISIGLSFECGGCYEALGVCSISCTGQCFQANDPESCECWDCVNTACSETFEACALFSLMDGVPSCPPGPLWECTGP